MNLYNYTSVVKRSGAANRSKHQPMIDSARNQASCAVLSTGKKKGKRNGLIAVSIYLSVRTWLTDAFLTTRFRCRPPETASLRLMMRN